VTYFRSAGKVRFGIVAVADVFNSLTFLRLYEASTLEDVYNSAFWLDP